MGNRNSSEAIGQGGGDGEDDLNDERIQLDEFVEGTAESRTPEDSQNKCLYNVGDIVEVMSRHWPGINKPGGVALIKEVCLDEGTKQYNCPVLIQLYSIIMFPNPILSIKICIQTWNMQMDHIVTLLLIP